MVYKIVPYAYDIKYAYGTEQVQDLWYVLVSVTKANTWQFEVITRVLKPLLYE